MKVRKLTGAKVLERTKTMSGFSYYWRVKTRFPERFGTKCRVLVRGSMNSALVEFEDGFLVVTSRNYLRRYQHENPD